MFQIDNLAMGYGGHSLFSNASFNGQPGEKIGLVGRNGSGKSTLFRLLIKKEIPDEGTISIRKNYRIGTLDQHIRFTKPTVIEEAALGLKFGEEDLIYKAETILFGLGFKKDDMYKEIGQFSGGYQLRLHLAKLLIGEPDCLLLDEPTNYLDIVSIRWLTRFLKLWKGEFILISHDREFMDDVTTHTMGIHRQKIKKVRGTTVDFYEQILLEEEIHEKTRQNLEKKRAHMQSFIDRFGAKASKATQAQSREKQLQRIPVLEKIKELNQLDFHFLTAPFPGKKMASASELAFSYTSEPMIENFSLEVAKGDRIAIVGKNGRGKSTLLRLLAKDLAPQHGTVSHGENLAIGYFGQTNIDRLHPKNSIVQEIALANPTLNTQETKAICGIMMFSGDLASKPTSLLSGGEKSRVLLGKILAKPCNFLMLDEPTHHLDMESVEALIDALEDFEGAIILVSHSELMLRRLNFDKIVVCHEGRQELFLGNYDYFLEKDGWHDAQESIKNSPQKKATLKESTPNNEKLKKKWEKEIAQKEMQIEKLESELKVWNEEILRTIESSDHQKSKEYGLKIEEIQKKIDVLYKELDALFKRQGT